MATDDFLENGNVYGARCLPLDRLAYRIDRCVRLAIPHLRHMTLPAIGKQTVFTLLDLPEDFRGQQAFKVYARGDEPWTDVERVEYWFVDRDGRWYWLSCDSIGGELDYGIGTSLHLVQRHQVEGQDGIAHIGILATIADSFRQAEYLAAHRARERANELDQFTAQMMALGESVSQIVDR